MIGGKSYLGFGEFLVREVEHGIKEVDWRGCKNGMAYVQSVALTEPQTST